MRKAGDKIFFVPSHTCPPVVECKPLEQILSSLPLLNRNEPLLSESIRALLLPFFNVDVRLASLELF